MNANPTELEALYHQRFPQSELARKHEIWKVQALVVGVKP
jgi:hypothetical protein